LCGTPSKVEFAIQNRKVLHEVKNIIRKHFESTLLLLLIYIDELLHYSLARSSILNVANQSDASCMSWMGKCPKAQKLVTKITRETEKWESEIFSYRFDECADTIIREIEQVSPCLIEKLLEIVKLNLFYIIHQIAHEKGTTEALRRCALLRCDTSGEIYETVIDVYTHV
jgi:hypothetical protein